MNNEERRRERLLAEDIIGKFDIIVLEDADELRFLFNNHKKFGDAEVFNAKTVEEFLCLLNDKERKIFVSKDVFDACNNKAMLDSLKIYYDGRIFDGIRRVITSYASENEIDTREFMEDIGREISSKIFKMGILDFNPPFRVAYELCKKFHETKDRDAAVLHAVEVYIGMLPNNVKNAVELIRSKDIKYPFHLKETGMERAEMAELLQKWPDHLVSCYTTKDGTPLISKDVFVPFTEFAGMVLGIMSKKSIDEQNENLYERVIALV